MNAPRHSSTSDSRTPRQIAADERREATEAHYERQREAERAYHEGIVKDALTREYSEFAPYLYDEIAAVAVDALLNDGVVFARLGRTDGDT